MITIGNQMFLACALLLFGSQVPLTTARVLTCANVKCGWGQICQMIRGAPTCVPNSKVNCYAVGDPHINSFDNNYYDFQGTCTYTLVKYCGKDKSLTNFTVEASNENRYGNTQVSYVSDVTVKIFYLQETVVINAVNFDNGFVTVNGQHLHIPLQLTDGTEIFQSGNELSIITPFGLQVTYDWNYMLNIYLTNNYFQNVCGMCGNYNGDPSDDFATPSGVQAANPDEFGKSWKVNGNKHCLDDCNGKCESCPPEKAEKFLDEKMCGLISSETGPFNECHAVVKPKTFVDNCVYDVCLNEDFKELLCQSLATYASMCQRNNVRIKGWREWADCPLKCPENSVPVECGRACNPTCNDAAVNPLTCRSLPCAETCQCNEGFVLNGQNCIRKEECGCIYEGKQYAQKESFYTAKCEKKCFCNPKTREAECEDTKCGPKESCKAVEGILGCYP